MNLKNVSKKTKIVKQKKGYSKVSLRRTIQTAVKVLRKDYAELAKD